MATERRAQTCTAILLAAALLPWPALYNSYPLVFADTGTYLSQAIEHYVGWDRPIFYSLFLLPLHLTLTTWPVVAAQALLTAHTLHLVRRTLLPGVSPYWLLPLVALLALTTSLPWLVSQLMPDLFMPLLVLVLTLLVLAPERCSKRELVWLVLFATFMIATHQSALPLALGLLLPLRHWLGAASPMSWPGLVRSVAPLVLAAAAMIAVNIAAFGRASLSPFGNVFLLARVIYDGPGMDVLQRDCPHPGWRLCAYLDRFPPNSDEFLWRPDSPITLLGGAKLASLEADAIIGAALRAEPDVELRAFATNAAQQLALFASGDGLQAWPGTVTPWIQRDFPPSEAAAYAASRQSNGALSVPGWMRMLHAMTALAGIAGCGALVAFAGRGLLRGFAVAVLLALVGNAAITGGLSGPHDRYQSRMMWLPPLIALFALPLVPPPGR